MSKWTCPRCGRVLEFFQRHIPHTTVTNQDVCTPPSDEFAGHSQDAATENFDDESARRRKSEYLFQVQRIFADDVLDHPSLEEARIQPRLYELPMGDRCLDIPVACRRCKRPDLRVQNPFHPVLQDHGPCFNSGRTLTPRDRIWVWLLVLDGDGMRPI